MKIFTPESAQYSQNAEKRDTLRKTILAVLFICLAITALADSVHLFNQASNTNVTPYSYVNRWH